MEGSSIKPASRLEVAKIAIAPASAIFVALVGWALTSNHNSVQQALATQRAEADGEVARINAAIRYLELVRDFSAEDGQRLQADSIAAPVLPPALAFRLAIDRLSQDSAILDGLLEKYENKAFAYLARHLEVSLDNLTHTFEIKYTELAKDQQKEPKRPTKSEKRAIKLLSHLRERGQSEEMLDYLVSKDYTNEQLRPIALVLYLHEYRVSLGYKWELGSQGKATRFRIKEELRSDLDDRTLSEPSKQALAFAHSVVFGYPYSSSCDAFLREAAERFWVNLDVKRFAKPARDSFQSRLYEREFKRNECRQQAIEIASGELVDSIRALSVRDLTFEEIRGIIYVYAERASVSDETIYLVPKDVVEVMRWFLDGASTAARREELARMLGTFVGADLFNPMLPSKKSSQATTNEDEANEDEANEDEAECQVARAFAEILLEWYGEHHVEDWYPPKFFNVVAAEFPDLESRVNRKAWGLDEAGSQGGSRRCKN